MFLVMTPEVIVKNLEDYAVNNYLPLYEAYKTGKQVDDSAIRFAQAAILFGLEKEDDGVDMLTTFNTAIKNSASTSTLNQIRSNFDNQMVHKKQWFKLFLMKLSKRQ